MSTDLTLIIIVLIGGFASLYFLLYRQLTSNRQDNSTLSTLTEWLKTTQSDINNLSKHLTQTLLSNDKNLTDTLQKSYTELNQRLDHTTRIVGELKTETGKFSEIGRSMKDLQDFLNSPKLRGNLGEQILADLLAQVLPPNTFDLQYRFNQGDTVDAVIRTASGLIPIDSKFPMENFLRLNQAESSKEQDFIRKQFQTDVKRHLKTIAEKYIRTSEKTIDFALMYIPSESVYYEITSHSPELTNYAQDLRVLPVSPSTFYAFLRTILVSFEGQRIQEEAQVVLQNLRDIQKSANEFNDKFQVMGRHLTNAYHNLNSLSSDFSQLQTKIDTTRTLGTGISTQSKLSEGV